MSKIHDIKLPVKYFEPIQNEEITLLIFERKVIDKFSHGDRISLRNGGYEVNSLIEDTYIKSFGEITEEEVKRAGFLNKDFLKDELSQRFNIDGLDILLTDFNSKIFFFIDLKRKGIPYASMKKNTTKDLGTTKISDDYFDFFGKKMEKIDDWTNEISKVKYNMEYYDKPWRDYDEEF